MAAEQHNTPTTPCDPDRPRAWYGYELESIVVPLADAARILSMVDTTRSGPGADDAMDWLTGFINDRAQDLRSILNGHQPAWRTDAGADSRAKLFEGLPTIARQRAALAARGAALVGGEA